MISTRTGLARLAPAAGAAVLLLALTACSAGSDAKPAAGKPSASPTGITVLQPGKPGESASAISPEDAPTPAAWNDADLRFVQMMIPHHTQALKMSGLAEDHAQDPQVRAIADRILDSQGPEIHTMSAWLQERGYPKPPADHGSGHGAHAQHQMTGMLTDAEMADLAAARGPRFDRLFLESMIGHHRGALQMAGVVAVDGSAILVNEMSADVTATQSAEIDRMRDLLRDL